MEDRTLYPRLRLRIMLAPGQWLGPGKADLLEAIADTGSISAAGRRMGMSYKRAWGLVEGLNEMFGAPLVAASRGGAAHGGAGLTDLGAEVLAWMIAGGPAPLEADLLRAIDPARFTRQRLRQGLGLG
jgi:molybdate transport system regulatory protein